MLANGATSATLAGSTTLDQYLIQVATFTTALSTPRLEVAKSVADLNGGDVQPGDVLRYTVTTHNGGDDGATGVHVQDPVPAGTMLVPGSLTGPGGAAAADGRSVGFALGTLAAAASATVSFDVVVDAGVPDEFVVANVASASGSGATAGRPVAAVSPQVTSIVRRPPFEGSLAVTPEKPVAGKAAVAKVTVINRLSRAIEDVSVSVSVPGADVLSAKVQRGDSCTGANPVDCSVGTLDPGEQATVRVRLRPRDGGLLRPVVNVQGKGVATQRLTVGEFRVKRGRARLTVTKRADASVARRGRAVTYRIVVSAARRGATAHRVRVCDVPGAGMRLRSASRGSVLRAGRACWRLGRLAPGRRHELTAVARVTAGTGIVRNTARVRGTNLRGRAPVVSVARVRVASSFPRACAAAAGPHARAAC